MGDQIMANPQITIFDLETGEEVTRDMTPEEAAQYDIDNEKMNTDLTAETEAATAKAALLERLGITAEEAALLLK
jgi:hypothetical protein